ncbi:MAG TPA: hypothetical protein VF735_22560 [Pyrinomonadaceae bacterium]|jgi:hypothetical protein
MLRIAELKKTGAQATSPAGQAFNQTIDTLLQKQFHSVDDLWESIGPKFMAGITRLETQTGITKEQLLEVLAEGAQQEPEAAPGEHWTKFKAWLRGRRFVMAGTWLWSKVPALAYWPELLALLILGVLAALMLSHAAWKRDAVMVRTETGLPAFHVINEDDLEVKQAINIPGSLTSKSSAVGHYLLQQLPKGARLYANQISKVQLSDEDVADRHVLSVPVKAGAISPTLSPLDRVRLLFSPHLNNETNNNPDTLSNVTSIDDVIILSINRQGDSSSIVVALKADLAEVARLLSSSDMLVSQPMRGAESFHHMREK